MPSSSEEVATSAGSGRALSASSISSRGFFGHRAVVGADRLAGRPRAAAGRRRPSREDADVGAALAGCCSASGSSAGRSSSRCSLSRSAVRSARRRELQKTSVVRCDVDHVDDARDDRGPDRLAGQLAEVVDRGDHLEVERLAVARRRRSYGRGARAAPPRKRAPLPADAGGRQADALERLAGQPLQALERQRQVGAALGADQRVDLVDDHRVDGREHAARALGGQHQVERLGRRDQDLGRACSIRSRSPAGVSPVRTADPDRRQRLAAARGRGRMPSSGTCRLRSTSLLSALSGET